MRRRLVPRRSGEEEQEDEDVTMGAGDGEEEEEEEELAASDAELEDDEEVDDEEEEDEEDEDEDEHGGRGCCGGSEEETKIMRPDGSIAYRSPERKKKDKDTDKSALKKALKKRGDAADAKKTQGIRWGPFLFLVFMMGPAVFGAVDFLMTKFKLYGPPDPKTCLTRYYRAVHPARLEEINLDDVLAKYKGKERQLYRNLEAKYRVKFECE